VGVGALRIVDAQMLLVLNIVAAYPLRYKCVFVDRLSRSPF